MTDFFAYSEKIDTLKSFIALFFHPQSLRSYRLLKEVKPSLDRSDKTSIKLLIFDNLFLSLDYLVLTRGNELDHSLLVYIEKILFS